MNKLLFTIAMSASILCNAAFADNKVRNGGFELKPIPGFFKHTNQIDHWQVMGGATGELQKPGHIGKQHLELASNKGYRIRQVIGGVTPGDMYVFSFWAKPRTARFARLNYGIRGGGECTRALPVPGTSSGNLSKVLQLKSGWKKYTHCICAKSRRMTIWFEHKEPTGGGYGIHLDDVRLVN